MSTKPVRPKHDLVFVGSEDPVSPRKGLGRATKQRRGAKRNPPVSKRVSRGTPSPKPRHPPISPSTHTAPRSYAGRTAASPASAEVASTLAPHFQHASSSSRHPVHPAPGSGSGVGRAVRARDRGSTPGSVGPDTEQLNYLFLNLRSADGKPRSPGKAGAPALRAPASAHRAAASVAAAVAAGFSPAARRHRRAHSDDGMSKLTETERADRPGTGGSRRGALGPTQASAGPGDSPAVDDAADDADADADARAPAHTHGAVQPPAPTPGGGFLSAAVRHSLAADQPSHSPPRRRPHVAGASAARASAWERSAVAGSLPTETFTARLAAAAAGDSGRVTSGPARNDAPAHARAASGQRARGASFGAAATSSASSASSSAPRRDSASTDPAPPAPSPHARARAEAASQGAGAQMSGADAQARRASDPPPVAPPSPAAPPAHWPTPAAPAAAPSSSASSLLTDARPSPGVAAGTAGAGHGIRHQPFVFTDCGVAAPALDTSLSPSTTGPAADSALARLSWHSRQAPHRSGVAYQVSPSHASTATASLTGFAPTSASASASASRLLSSRSAHAIRRPAAAGGAASGGGGSGSSGGGSRRRGVAWGDALDLSASGQPGSGHADVIVADDYDYDDDDDDDDDDDVAGIAVGAVDARSGGQYDGVADGDGGEEGNARGDAQLSGSEADSYTDPGTDDSATQRAAATSLPARGLPARRSAATATRPGATARSPRAPVRAAVERGVVDITVGPDPTSLQPPAHHPSHPHQQHQQQPALWRAPSRSGGSVGGDRGPRPTSSASGHSLSSLHRHALADAGPAALRELPPAAADAAAGARFDATRSCDTLSESPPPGTAHRWPASRSTGPASVLGPPSAARDPALPTIHATTARAVAAAADPAAASRAASSAGPVRGFPIVGVPGVSLDTPLGLRAGTDGGAAAGGHDRGRDADAGEGVESYMSRTFRRLQADLASGRINADDVAAMAQRMVQMARGSSRPFQPPAHARARGAPGAQDGDASVAATPPAAPPAPPAPPAATAFSAAPAWTGAAAAGGVAGAAHAAHSVATGVGAPAAAAPWDGAALPAGARLRQAPTTADAWGGPAAGAVLHRASVGSAADLGMAAPPSRPRFRDGRASRQSSGPPARALSRAHRAGPSPGALDDAESEAYAAADTAAGAPRMSRAAGVSPAGPRPASSSSSVATSISHAQRAPGPKEAMFRSHAGSAQSGLSTPPPVPPARGSADGDPAPLHATCVARDGSVDLAAASDPRPAVPPLPVGEVVGSRPAASSGQASHIVSPVSAFSTRSSVQTGHGRS